MKKIKEPHPDQHIHDATWDYFVEKHGDRPFAGVVMMMLFFLGTLISTLYVCRNNPEAIGPSILVVIAVDVLLLHYAFPRCCKKYISRSKRHQQKYFQKIQQL